MATDKNQPKAKLVSNSFISMCARQGLRIGAGALVVAMGLTSVAHAQDGDAKDKPAAGDAAAEKAPEAKPEPKPEEKQPAADSKGSKPAKSDKETSCTDRMDNDGDTVVDCADSDCYDHPACKPSGLPESTNSLCSDFIDNDGDGALDCADMDCQGPGVTVCKGSWHGGGSANVTMPAPLDIPDDGKGVSVEELVGKGSDKDGERNDALCSDGVDNDGDGRVDCADIGCRFDPSVTVCRPNPGMRFSVVGQITYSHFFERPNERAAVDDVRFSALQLRALGPIPGIQNSFFLLNMRAERTPRMSFAFFQVPIGTKGFFFNINSGGGGLSTELIRSIAKAPLLEPAFYMLNAFEQGNGAAAEFGGPITDNGKLYFRTFLAGGSGRQNGNVGGRFFSDDKRNFTYAAGGQLTYSLKGHYNRFDTPFLYTPLPLTAAVRLGAKYDQRAFERYPAGNFQGIVRYGRFLLWGEVYGKKELEFESTQVAYNVMAGALIIPRHLFIAADFGAFLSGEVSDSKVAAADPSVRAEIQKQRDEQQFRGAVHWYFYRNIGVLTAFYKLRDVKDSRAADDSGFKEREFRLVGQYRF